MKRLVFDLTKIKFLKRLIGISRLIVEILNDQNLFTESNLVDWFSSYVQFFQENIVFQTAQEMNNTLKSNTKW